MESQIVIHQATTNDVVLIQGILKQTAQWLKSIGSTQWSEILEGKDNHNTPLAIERGEVYYATMDNQVAGMFILWNKQSSWDKEMWGMTTIKNGFICIASILYVNMQELLLLNK